MAEVESVVRGLEILRLLNERPGQSLSELTERAALPRGTTYRMLFTLEAVGLVERADNVYGVTQRVRTLSHGFDDDWAGEVARPIVRELGRELHWPITLSEHSGGQALVRETTDSESSLVFEATRPGFRMSMLDTASGRVLLAYSSSRKQRAILDFIQGRSTGISDFGRTCCRGRFTEIAGSIRERGYDVLPVPERRQTAMAVPVRNKDGHAVAALAIRYFNVAMPHCDAVKKFLDPLRYGADRIGQHLRHRNVGVQ
jgi:IclR family mhp operon transcriptional activator